MTQRQTTGKSEASSKKGRAAVRKGEQDQDPGKMRPFGIMNRLKDLAGGSKRSHDENDEDESRGAAKRPRQVYGVEVQDGKICGYGGEQDDGTQDNQADDYDEESSEVTDDVELSSDAINADEEEGQGHRYVSHRRDVNADGDEGQGHRYVSHRRDVNADEDEGQGHRYVSHRRDALRDDDDQNGTVAAFLRKFDGKTGGGGGDSHKSNSSRDSVDDDCASSSSSSEEESSSSDSSESSDSCESAPR